MGTQMIDYRKFRLRKLNTPEFRHLKLLLFWPVFLLIFKFLEAYYWVREYHPVESELDALIPFNEYFVLPYMFWHLFEPGILLWLLLHDRCAFSKMMRFIMVTYGITLLIYCIYPTCQNLRPETFANDNILTRWVALIYRVDTNTNVCPSIHVIGSLAAVFASFNTFSIRRRTVKIVIAAIGILICASTVFMKQHSIIDVMWGTLLSVAAYPIFRWVPSGERASVTS